MNDDELMDQLLRDAMAGHVPQLSPAFDARIIDRVRPRRLSRLGRVTITAYAIAAAAATVWLMRDLGIALAAAAVVISVSAAVGVSAYVRRLAAMS